MKTVNEWVKEHPLDLDGWYERFTEIYPQWSTEHACVYFFRYDEIYFEVKMYWKHQKRYGVITKICNKDFTRVAEGNKYADGLTKCSDFAGGQIKEENIMMYDCDGVPFRHYHKPTPKGNKLLLLT